MEPPNKGHVGTSHFVHCREVVFPLEVENVLVVWESEHLEPSEEVSFIERLLCLLFGDATIAVLLHCYAGLQRMHNKHLIT